MSSSSSVSRSEKFARGVLKWRWAILFATLVLTLFLTSGARFLTFRGDYRVFFGEDNPQLKAFDALQDVYSKSDNLLFVLEPKDGDVFTKETLESIHWLTAQSWERLPYSTRVDSLSNFPYTEGTEDELIVKDMVEDPELLDEAELAKIKTFALNEPLLVHRIVSPSAAVTAVNVTFNLPGKDITELDEVFVVIRAMEAEYREKYPDVNVYLSGVLPLNQAFSESAKGDMMTLVPLMYLLLLITMAWTLRSITGTIVTFIVVGMSAATAMGFAGWIGIVITPQSVLAPTMILTMAIADSIHILVPFLEWMRKGWSKADAMAESLRINLLPVFITSITTAMGFMSMNFTDTPPLHDLGNITSVGVLFAFLFSIFFVPAIVMVLPFKVKQAEEGKSDTMDRFGDWVVRKHRTLIIVSGLLMVAVSMFITKNDLNDEFVKYFDHSVRFRRDSEFTSKNLTGIYQINFSLESGESSGISDPKYLAKIEEFANWCRDQPDVLHVSVLSDTFKRLNKNMHADDQEQYKLPENRELASQYLLLYEMSLPFGQDLNNQINVDRSSTKLTITLNDSTSGRMRELAAQGKEWLKTNAPESMLVDGAGAALMFAYISERNINGMLLGTGIALVGISFILMFALRSWKFGVISLVPNLLPAAVSFGIWGLFVGQVGMSLSVVTAMTLGIVVDDTVHFLSKYLQARREKKLEAPDAVRYAFSQVGRALVVTSVILIAGFSVLATSSFAQNSQMGKLSAITIAVALAADFFFLPPLLILLDKKKID